MGSELLQLNHISLNSGLPSGGTYGACTSLPATRGASLTLAALAAGRQKTDSLHTLDVWWMLGFWYIEWRAPKMWHTVSHPTKLVSSTIVDKPVDLRW